ncbi:MAG: hypothetical protein WA231_01035 [Methylocella sp.]
MKLTLGASSQAWRSITTQGAGAQIEGGNDGTGEDRGVGEVFGVYILGFKKMDAHMAEMMNEGWTVQSTQT